MVKLEVVGPEVLERELTSNRFLHGLEKAVEITLDTGRETSFDIQKELFGNQIIYPSLIYIGNEVKCGEVEALKHALDRYKKHFEATGKTWIEPRGSGFNREDFGIFCTQNRLLSEEYPEISDYYSQENRNAVDFYTFLTVHTHPSFNLTPSLNDLNSLNVFRKNVEYLGIITKPIMIIAGVDKNDKSHKLLFLQEKGKGLIKKDKLPELKKEIDDFLDPRVRLAMDIFGIKQKEYYNKGLGYFNRKNREISFDFDLNDFAYRLKAEAA